MPIFDLYSKRQKRMRGSQDVFQYDEIPQALRIQIVHIWRDALGNYEYSQAASEMYDTIHDILCREFGVFELVAGWYEAKAEALSQFFTSCKDVERAIDIIELVFKIIEDTAEDSDYSFDSRSKITAEEAIEELNGRFLEHGVGYQYQSGLIIRKDSEILHTEVVKSILNLINNKEYEGVNDEFLKAHEHYRHNRYKECLNECLKAFESTMKTICHKRGWHYNQNDTAKKLIEICLNNNLIPSYLQAQLTSLKSVLESGIPTVRNKLGGHGQGAQQIAVPNFLVGYVLHLTATTILMLINAEMELP